jgi:hypothetical protein
MASASIILESTHSLIGIINAAFVLAFQHFMHALLP